MKKWSEKTTFEITADIISESAFVLWLIFDAVGKKSGAAWTEIAGFISIMVICVLQGIAFWNQKRVISYIAIAGFVCLVVALVLLA